MPKMMVFWPYTVNRGNFGRIWDVCFYCVSLDQLLDLEFFASVRQCLEEVDCKFLCKTDQQEWRNQASFSVRSYPGNWGNFGQLQKSHRNPYREFLWFFKVEGMAFDAAFSVRDGSRDQKNNHIKAVQRNFSVTLTNSTFVDFLECDVTLRPSYPVTILFPVRCNAIFVKSVTSRLFKTKQVSATYKESQEINKIVKIWCVVRSYPGCPKLPWLTV